MDKSDIKIDFVNFSEFVDESISYPMGILYISAYLKKNGFTNIGYVDHICLLRKIKESETKPNIWSPKDLEQTHNNCLEDLQKYLNERQPRILLLGPVTSAHLVELVDLVPKLREAFPQTLIIAGGPHFGKVESLDKELLRQCGGLNAITIGEAEETILEIVNLFHLKESRLSSKAFLEILSSIQGLQTVDNKNVIPRQPPDLDTLPAPDWELLETYWKQPKIRMWYRYSITNRRNPTVRVSREIFVGDSDWGAFDEDVNYFGEFTSRNDRFPFGVIMGSRGCPYNCSFCCSPANRRLHTAQFIFDQITYLYTRFGIKQFYFFDPLFTTLAPIEQKRVSDLSQMICNSKLNVRYAIEIRADIIVGMPEPLLSLLISSGCVEFNLGLEKGSNRLLEKTAKRMTVETQSDAIAKIRKVAAKVGKEVLINGTFILGGPGETQADIRDTLIHCISLGLDEAALFPLEIHPGTQCHKRAIEIGLLEDGLSPYLKTDRYPLYATEVLSAEYLWNVQRLSSDLFKQLDEFKGKLQELEIQFLPQNKRSNYSKYRLGKTQTIQNFANACIQKILDYEIDCSKVETNILSKERQLLKKYPNYDPDYGDYHTGDIQEAWDNCLEKMEHLFQGSRKRIRFYGGEPNAY